MTLYVGTTSAIHQAHTYNITRPNPAANGSAQTFPNAPIYNDLLYTGPVTSDKGVQIEVATAGLVTHATDGHPGVVFNCNGRLQDGAFQALTGTSAGAPALNPVWVRGRGIIFLPGGELRYERWFHDTGVNHKNGGAGFHTETLYGPTGAQVNYNQYNAILVTCTTRPNGTGILAVYGTTGLGGSVQALLWQRDFADGETITDMNANGTTAKRSIPPGIYAAAFAYGPGIKMTVRPRLVT